MSRAWNGFESTAADVERIRVGVADAAVSADETPLVTSGLGSCVAVALYDDTGLGGLLHAMLPRAPPDVDNPAKYVDSGFEALVNELDRRGVNRGKLSAKLTGGSSMLNLGGDEPIGDTNVEAARLAVREAGVELVATDTGGESGRSISFTPATGIVTIKRVDAVVNTI